MMRIQTVSENITWEETLALAGKVAAARKKLSGVRITDYLLSFIAELCRTNHVAGHRADLVIRQGALAHAAWQGRTQVTLEDISAVSGFALLHRKQEAADPPPPPPEDPDHKEDDTESRAPDEDAPPPPGLQPEETQSGEDRPQNEPSGKDTDGRDNRADDPPQTPEINFDIGETFKVKKIVTPKDRQVRRGSGRRSRTRVSGKQGRYVKSTQQRGSSDIALDATLRAAAPHQVCRGTSGGLLISLETEDIREKIREKKVGNFLLFLVDASGSMGAAGRMSASKGAVLSLLLDAYQKRDRVAMVSFRRTEAVVNLPVTSSVELAARHLSNMPVGGRTPLSAGLDKAYQMVRNVLFRDPSCRPILVVITDGKSNVAQGGKKTHGRSV